MGAADTPLSELARQLSERTPAPGGGAAAAAAAALAAGLVEMAAQFTLARAEYAELHSRAREIAGIAAQARAQSLGLIEHDLEAYAPVLEAQALPRTDPARNGQIRAASSRAAPSGQPVPESGQPARAPIGMPTYQRRRSARPVARRGWQILRNENRPVSVSLPSMIGTALSWGPRGGGPA